MMKSELVNKLKEIIQENSYFQTPAGERFKNWNDINIVQDVISFSGRSKNHQGYELSNDSDKDELYVTHLMIDRYGEVFAVLSGEDTDDFGVLVNLNTEYVHIEHFDDDIIREWVELLNW